MNSSHFACMHGVCQHGESILSATASSNSHAWHGPLIPLGLVTVAPPENLIVMTLHLICPASTLLCVLMRGK